MGGSAAWGMSEQVDLFAGGVRLTSTSPHDLKQRDVAVVLVLEHIAGEQTASKSCDTSNRVVRQRSYPSNNEDYFL